MKRYQLLLSRLLNVHQGRMEEAKDKEELPKTKTTLQEYRRNADIPMGK